MYRCVGSVVVMKNMYWTFTAPFMFEPISNALIMKAAETF